MTNKSNYTEEEWDLLRTAPILTGFAVARIGQSGLGTFKEAAVLSAKFAAGTKEYPNNDLIRALSAKEEANRAEKGAAGIIKGKKPPEIVTAAASLLAQVKKILDAKSDAQESDEYRKWVTGIGVSAAKAVKEGGHLGFGGVRVSEPEKKALAAIADALDADLPPELAQ
jgi:hypothetical protein